MIDGPTLYANHCAACHRALASSTKVGATVARMQGAIAGNVGGMGPLSSLTAAELQAIEAALAPVAPPAPVPQPASPNYTGMWWNPAESGWGINISHQGDIVFATLFTYADTGAPMWVMMSGPRQPDGRTYSGDLYQATGPAFNAQPFTPVTGANVYKVGAMSLTFSAADKATLSYTYGGVAVTKEIVPQVFGTAAASCVATTGSRASLTNYQDMWWNPAESGWGVNIVHQNSTLFAVLMTYDLAGDDFWLVMAGTQQPDGSYPGDLYLTKGPPFNAQPYTPLAAADQAKVGTMRFTFSDGITGTMAYTVNGAAVSKTITRQVFGSTVPACSSPAAPPPPVTDGPTLYANHCAACHGALANSAKGGATLARTQGAIAANVGGMGSLSGLSTQNLQAIVAALAALAPAPPPACGSCHAIPPATGVHPKHDARYACSSCHGAGYSATAVNAATHNNGIRDLLASVGWNAAAGSCTSACHGPASWSPTATLPCSSCHAVPPSAGGHVKHDTRFSCSTCHGAGYSATTVNAATHNDGTRNVQASVGWNAANASCTNSCHGVASWTPSASLSCTSCHAVPPGTGDHANHNSRFSCSGCHGTGYSATTVNVATHRNGIKDLAAGAGWNGTSRTCTNACHTTASWSSTAALACGSCHAIPPATGRHSKHKSRYTCSTCHGAGYSTTAVNAATHRNGTKEVVATTGWNGTTRSCTNSCHGRETW